MGAPPPAAGLDPWAAQLRLGFEVRGQQTLLAERYQRGPLAVQRPFYPEGGTCHCYLLHPPGGLVGGDQLDIDIGVAAGAQALLTTPGATKCYRSAGPFARQTQRLRVTGTLEWLPQETILFPGALVKLGTRVELVAGARFIGWELLALGRPSIGEPFDRGEATQTLEVWADGRPLLIERLALEPAAGARQAAAGLRGLPLSGTLLAWPADATDLEAARAALPGAAGDWCAFSLIDGLLVGRYLGSQAEQARLSFVPVWRALRPRMLGREAVTPRIWAT